MTRPIARVLALLEILQAGGTRTVTDLARRLDVDERTVRRYAGHLIELDIPVRSVRGRYGGYRLAPGYRMPPLMLTDDEALAVLLGLVAGRRAGVTSATAMESAAAKIRRVLPDALGRRLDALLATTDFTTAARPAATQETAILLMLAEAARHRQPVAVSYLAQNGKRSERTVHPYGIVVHAGRWYVTGADSASGEVRTFRLDRIETATVRPGSFEIPAGFDPAARVLSGLAEVPYQHEVSLRVLGTAEQVRARLPAGIATVQEIPPDPAAPDPGAQGPAGPAVRVRLRAERLDWIPALLAGLDRPFVIEYPDALREHVHALARRLITSAGDVPGQSLPHPVQPAEHRVGGMTLRLVQIAMNARDDSAVGRFWAEALGWSVSSEEPGVTNVEPVGFAYPDPVAVCIDIIAVPEPKTVKNRVHVDLATTSAAHQADLTARLQTLGATPADVGQGNVPWTVLADPEGNEFCVLEPPSIYRDTGPIAAVVADCADPRAMARFWGEAMDWTLHEVTDEHAVLRSAKGVGPYLKFLRTPDTKTAKNRTHLDLRPYPGDDQAAEVARLRAMGATDIDLGQGDVPWACLADPEGNEFDVLTPR